MPADNTTQIVTAYTAPNRTRVAVVRFQGRDFTVRQTPKKVTTVWLGTVRITKKDQPNAWHAIAGAALTEWESPVQVREAIVTETVETWGPDPVVVTREYDELLSSAPVLAARARSEAAWEEEAHAAGFANGDDYATFLTEELPEPAAAELSPATVTLTNPELWR